MRLLTSFDTEQTAILLAEVLYARGIGASINETRDGQHAVWVHEEARLDDARFLLEHFDENDQRFAAMAKQAREQRRQEQQQARALEERTRRIKADMEATRSNRVGTATMTLIVLCVLVAIYSKLGDDRDVVYMLTLTKWVPIGETLIQSTGLDILAKEPWRLFTPMFLHFGFLHILFNLWWLKDLGTAIERVFSARYLLALVAVIAVVSHLASIFLQGPTVFGGMSGVVYGLFSFIWIRGRFDLNFPYSMPKQIVTFMMIWFFLGFTGWVGPIANVVHAGGLVTGAVWGYLTSGDIKRRFSSR